MIYKNAPYFKDNDFRLLFLDIDGVFNSTKTALTHGGYPHVSRQRDEGDGIHMPSTRIRLAEPPVSDPDWADRETIELVDRVLNQTDTHVVLSSTWRMGLNVSQCRAVLQCLGLDSYRVIGRTDHGKGSECRGDEIEQFLTHLKTKDGITTLITGGLLLEDLASAPLPLIPKKYMIIDDDSDMLEHHKIGHFVQTDNYNGTSLLNILHLAQGLQSEQFKLSSLSERYNCKDDDGNYVPYAP